MTHDPHLFLNIHVVCSAGEKARLVIRKPFPGRSKTRGRIWGTPLCCSDFLAPGFESVEAGSTSPMGRGACAGPTLCWTLYEVPGLEMSRMWRPPRRRSQFRGGDGD